MALLSLSFLIVRHFIFINKPYNVLQVCFYISGGIKQVANWILLCLMIGAIVLHWAVDDKLERSAPALVFFFMLTCRLVVEWQIQRQAKAEAKAAAKATTGQTHSNIPAKLAKSE